MAAEDFGNWYSNGVLETASANIDYEADDIRILIVNESHVFTKGNKFVADIVANEVAGAGYERKVLASKSVSLVVGTPDEVRWLAADLTYTDIDVNPDKMANAIVYKFVTDDADSILLYQAKNPTIETIGTSIDLRWPDGSGGVGVTMRLKNPIKIAA